MKVLSFKSVSFKVRAGLAVVCYLSLIPLAAAENERIVAPIGQKAKKDSVSVVIASDQGSTIGTATTVKSSAKEASHVLKASAGSLVSVAGSSDTDQWILIIDSATVPANGAVTLLYPPIHVPAGGNFSVNFTTPLAAATGIAICNSNANSFTKTLGAADCIFAAQVQ